METDFANIFAQLAVLFVLIGIGYAFKHAKIMDAAFDKTLSKLVLNLTLPCMILAATLTAESIPSPEQLGLIALVAVASYAIMLVAGLLFVWAMRVHSGHKGVFRFMMVFGNVGFIGFPVLNAVYGPEAIVIATVFNCVFNMLVFTVGVMFLQADNPTCAGGIDWKALRSPCMLACGIVIVCLLAGIHDVPYLGSGIDLIGDATVPMSLLVVGSSLANMPVRSLVGGPRLFVAALLRLLAMPALCWLVLHGLCDAQLAGIVALQCGMPVAANGSMMCLMYGGDSDTMAQGVFISSVLSVVTIPVLILAFV